MEVDLLDFVEQYRHLVKQALGKHAGEPASGGFARWVHVVLHCLRLDEGHSYRETPNRLKYMAEVRDVLGLDGGDLPDYSTIYKSFDRLKMWVWRALLRVSAQQHPESGHAALDSTFFDRRRASSYFRQRSGNTVQTLKLTILTNVESLAVLDVHIAARWKHDTKTGPQVVHLRDRLETAFRDGYGGMVAVLANADVSAARVERHLSRVGTIEVARVDPHRGSAEIGSVIRPETVTLAPDAWEPVPAYLA